jgi:hypothetical protein
MSRIFNHFYTPLLDDDGYTAMMIIREQWEQEELEQLEEELRQGIESEYWADDSTLIEP